MILTSTKLYKWFTNQFIQYYYNPTTKHSNYIKQTLKPKTTVFYEGRRLAKRSHTFKHKLLRVPPTVHTISTSALQHIREYNGTDGCNDFLTFDSDSFPIIMDTGAFYTMTMNKEDFIDLTPHNSTISGLGDFDVKGRGTVKWTILNDEDEPTSLIWRNVLYVSDLPISLVSPQQFLKHTSTELIVFRLHWSEMSLTIPYHPDSLMPIFYTRPGGETYAYLSGKRNFREFSPPDSRGDESPEREKDAFDVEINPTSLKEALNNSKNEATPTINYEL